MLHYERKLVALIVFEILGFKVSKKGVVYKKSFIRFQKLFEALCIVDIDIQYVCTKFQ